MMIQTDCVDYYMVLEITAFLLGQILLKSVTEQGDSQSETVESTIEMLIMSARCAF
jgi:hypothetical protein